MDQFLGGRSLDTIDSVQNNNLSSFSSVAMSWSPTADLLLFYANTESGSYISVIDPENNNVLNFADVSDFYVYGISWSPDGRFAVVYAEPQIRSSQSVIFVLDIEDNTAVRRPFQKEQIGDCQTSLADVASDGVIAYEANPGEVRIEHFPKGEITVYRTQQEQPIKFIDLSADGHYLLILYSEDCSSEAAILEIVDVQSEQATIISVLDGVRYLAEDYSARSLHLYRNADYESFWIDDTGMFLTQTKEELLLNSLSEGQIQTESILDLQNRIVEDIDYDYPLLAVAFTEESQEQSHVEIYDLIEMKLDTSILADQRISHISLDSHLDYVGFTYLGDAIIQDIRSSKELARIAIDIPAIPLSELLFSRDMIVLLGYVDPFTRAVHVYDLETEEVMYVTVCAYSHSCYGSLPN